jgi:predicted flap endonuclease-1-like 5' DNA nuclease
MSRKSPKDAASPRARQTSSAARPAPRPAADTPRAAASPDFPFARTVEDDELRDLSGYGWGV